MGGVWAGASVIGRLKASVDEARVGNMGRHYYFSGLETATRATPREGIEALRLLQEL